MDQAAFRVFYDKTMPTLRAYAIRRSGSVEIADDAVQEAFLQFLRFAPASLAEAQMRGYLYRTVENLIARRWHRAQRERQIIGETSAESGICHSPEFSNDMAAAFSKLEPKQQSLLWLAYVEGFDHKEIAAAANVKVKSVRVLLFRARQTLMDILKSAGLGPKEL